MPPQLPQPKNSDEVISIKDKKKIFIFHKKAAANNQILMQAINNWARLKGLRE